MARGSGHKIATESGTSVSCESLFFLLLII
jgi:hypothetical protein